MQAAPLGSKQPDGRQAALMQSGLEFVKWAKVLVAEILLARALGPRPSGIWQSRHAHASLSMIFLAHSPGSVNAPICLKP
jgi:lambda repressor-like predicted transcriptional regulator